MKPIVVDIVEKVQCLGVNRLEIVIDDANPDKVELYIVDHLGSRIEGGTFDKSAFMDHCLEFYDRNY